ncbi:MAG: HU family DNA-binding protein [Lentimicrobiaceae bacterium]|nr:HU family DNA-binding protein [Lentimicrobiaceae bacterium]MCB9024011.1 HU family DNA-binding protein [Lentimicrobiaceae bacterium]MCO5265769.1 HU family DNA-binding protein [Lentimicrobium sp.]HPG33128.1 HU family DNA-binding protein [Lentimicrobium sp.]
MNKTDLIGIVAAGAGLTKEQAKKAIDCYHDTIADTLKAGQKVEILGFGSFSAVTREARTGRNPKTGEMLTISAKTVAKFKPGKGLSEKL